MPEVQMRVSLKFSPYTGLVTMSDRTQKKIEDMLKGGPEDKKEAAELLLGVVTDKVGRNSVIKQVEPEEIVEFV